jgi:DNA helicase II / ATP-dependent DNA helicase PcrA
MQIDYEAIFEDKYSKLNSFQKEAVDTIDGPVMVLAGPGAGKTQLLSLRVANILKTTDARPYNILCLTFTDSGAKNMKDRLATIIGPEAYKVHISTFHSFAKSIMNLYPEKFFNGAMPKLLDDYSRKLLYKTILDDVRKHNYKNQLTVSHPDQGYVYQYSIDQKIGQFKSNGITPASLELILNRNQSELEYLSELISDVFSVRMSPKVNEQIPELIHKLMLKYQANQDNLVRLGDVPTLTKKYCDKLQMLYEQYRNDPDTIKASLLSDFKKNYLKPTNGIYHPKECVMHSKLYDLLEIYRKYEERIEEKSNIDFSDQVRLVVELLQNDNELRLEIQSKYQYVMVDEFQDTSLLQLNLINSLLNLEVTEGKPNILVVGDDDQSIYKFQGANLENLNIFASYFPTPPVLIPLEINYRSKKNIVELSQEIISHSSERFVSIYSDFSKKIIPNDDKDGNIEYLSYNTVHDEVADICKKIDQLKKDGVMLSEIALLARNHKQIAPFAKELEKLHIPLKYEKGQDILKSQHIRELVTLAKLILELSDHNKTDVLISSILSSEYWKLEGVDIYRLAIAAKKNKLGWIDAMLDSKELGLNPYLAEIASWLIEVANLARRYSAERLLDVLIGQHAAIGEEQGELELDASLDEETKKWRLQLDKITKFSPFGQYYYSYNRLNIDYLATLSALKTLINRVREYKKNNFLKLIDLVEFFDFHEQEKIAIIDNNVFNQDTNAVTLMTGHKAKGLEYEYVFVISANEDVWHGKGGRNMLVLPINMPFEAIPDNTDDFVRLFYVAVTRAKSHLYITRYENSDTGKTLPPVPALVNKNFKKVEVPIGDLARIVGDTVFDSSVVVDTTISQVLRPLVDEYKMPITHMWNYLDLDNDKGPKYFVENNLLRYPCSKNASSSYGTAVHSAIYQYYIRRMNGKVKVDDVIELFVRALGEENLAEKDYKHYEAKGIDTIQYFFEHNKPEDKYNLEVDFGLMDVHIGSAWVTGKIDKIVINESTKTLDVIDYKTGKGFDSFLSSSSKNKDSYRNQLLFYKLLIENSSFLENRYKVDKLALDFVEKGENFGLKQLNYDSNSDEMIELKKLIEIVYRKITTLQFTVPKEITTLEKGRNLAFKEWLLANPN